MLVESIAVVRKLASDAGDERQRESLLTENEVLKQEIAELERRLVELEAQSDA